MAFVLSVLICKSFKAQNEAKQSKRSWSSTEDGATRTKSSAKASINNCRDAIVYALLLLPCILRVL